MTTENLALMNNNHKKTIDTIDTRNNDEKRRHSSKQYGKDQVREQEPISPQPSIKSKYHNGLPINNNNNNNNNNTTSSHDNKKQSLDTQKIRRNNNNTIRRTDININNNSNSNNSVKSFNPKNKNTYNNNNNHRNNNQKQQPYQKNISSFSNKFESYPPHWESYETCLQHYNETTKSTIDMQYNVNIANKKTSTSTSNNQKQNDDDGNGNNNNNNNNNDNSIIIIRGKIKVLPGNDKTSTSFVSCDRGYINNDIIISTFYERNRSLDGDIVFIQLLDLVIEDNDNNHNNDNNNQHINHTDEDIITSSQLLHDTVATMSICDNHDAGDDGEDDDDNSDELWQDDEYQMDLWNPTVPIKYSKNLINGKNRQQQQQQYQWYGKVIYIIPPQIDMTSEIKSTNSDSYQQQKQHQKVIVGTLHELPHGNVFLLNPFNQSLPQFKVMPTLSKEQIQSFFKQAQEEEEEKERQKLAIEDMNNNDKEQQQQNQQRQSDQKNDNHDDDDGGDDVKYNISSDNSSSNNKDMIEANESSPTIPLKHLIVKGIYEYGSWKENHQWPPCFNIQYVGQSCVLHDEINALLMQCNVSDEQHSPNVLNDCYNVVQSGLCNDNTQWKPTSDMYHGRRDYRNERIFTIDPTTAKDLDDALHIKRISDTVVEIGVHIADVSYFVDPIKTLDLDNEAQKRSTSVYLVDRVIPMLPRPLCEIACSLNENVERLAFSCVWKMNVDGTIRMKKNSGKKKKNEQHNNKDEEPDVWYGRTIIKSCARLDYLTAQNIIDHPKITQYNESQLNELWPLHRRPVINDCIHTMEQIAYDVRLMNQIAQERRKLRIQHGGALELHSTKLVFQLDPNNNEIPKLVEPYPIRDSNHLIEEYMLLANYLVAQRLIEYCNDRACLRRHPSPLLDSLGEIQNLAKLVFNCNIDITNSKTLQHSLWNLSQQCNSDSTNNDNENKLKLQCITQLLMTPMKPAEYIAAGFVIPEEWKHFALNIPYYTHFTSPIRRYPDIIVHRLLQESIDMEHKKEQQLKRKQDTMDLVFTNDDMMIQHNDTNNLVDQAHGDDDDVNKWDAQKIHTICKHSNERKLASKYAQDRCDRIYLALYVRSNPIHNQLGIVLSVGVTTFTVFIPSYGFDTKIYLQEHKDQFGYNSPPTTTSDNTSTLTDREEAAETPSSSNGSSSGRERKIILTRHPIKEEDDKRFIHESEVLAWDTLEIKVYTKLQVTVLCKDTPPIDVKCRLVGPWIES